MIIDFPVSENLTLKELEDIYFDLSVTDKKIVTEILRIMHCSYEIGRVSDGHSIQKMI